MATAENNVITVTTTINKPAGEVWQLWTNPEHIAQWNNASEDWHTPKATNDLQKGGHFSFRMEARNGSFGFDFNGTYSQIKANELIEYTIEDGRKVQVLFEANGNQTKVTETFEAENENSTELQQNGWQAILDNFKKYAEAN
jgi:uncharacterized protein YndB with AHSA1/START domain